ncbi:RNA-binding protein [Candidatus Woesearchaeota archaeon CG10_big_fil_rev_8_21_14_0_10_34_8]|nr:MAG: RNA-binding protein [Candidatus Woesearchaeota archaeon CG10_big_fil_rev_8_21_14_0_10_34_8]
MGKLLVEERKVVVPGEHIAEGMDYLPAQWTYRKGDNILAGRLGLLAVNGRALKIIPLSGTYTPKKDDVIIGKVIDVAMSGWRVETNSAYSAMLSVRDATSEFISRNADLTKFFDLGDYLVAKIVKVTSQKLIDVSTKGPGLRKLYGGRVINVNCNKVPRIIGKQGSMVSLIKNSTGCKIIVGQNGIIWLSGSPDQEVIAIETIKKIEKEAHVSGLTEKITAYLEKKCKNKPAVMPEEDSEENSEEKPAAKPAANKKGEQ